MTRKILTRLLHSGDWHPNRLIVGLMLLIFPTWLVRHVVNACGHAIGLGARIGFSLMIVDRLVMAPDARVGHFNLVQVRRLLLRNNARLGNLNVCKGPISLRLAENAMIGNRNTITRAVRGTTFGSAQFCLGKLAKITAGHSLDCTQTIRLGHYSTLAGKGSQIWTHGYPDQHIDVVRSRAQQLPDCARYANRVIGSTESDFLRILMDSGLATLFLYLGVMVASLRKATRRASENLFHFLLIILAMSIFPLIQSLNATLLFWIYIWGFLENKKASEHA